MRFRTIWDTLTWGQGTDHYEMVSTTKVIFFGFLNVMNKQLVCSVLDVPRVLAHLNIFHQSSHPGISSSTFGAIYAPHQT